MLDKPKRQGKQMPLGSRITPIVLMIAGNAGDREGGVTCGTACKRHTDRTQNRGKVRTKLASIARMAKENTKAEFCP